MEVSDLFSQGFDILKKNIVIAVPLIAVGIAVGILNFALMGSMSPGMGMGGMNGFTPDMAAFGAVMGAAFLIGIIGGILNLLASGMTYILADEGSTGKADLNSAFTATLDNIVNLLITAILLGVIVFIGFLLLFLPGLIAAYFLMFTLVIVMLEKKGPVESIQRSFELVKNNIGDTIIFAIIALVIFVLGGIIGGIFGFIPVIGRILISPVISGIVGAYVSIVLVLLYRNLSKQ